MAEKFRPPFRLITLGRLALVDADGREEPTLASRRRKLALLAVLALARRPLSRDRLIDLFWGERDESRARNSLSDALSHLRRVLGRAALPAYRDEIGLADETPLTIDVLELRRAALSGDHARVVTLYAGAFLDGVHVDEAPGFEDWRHQIRTDTDAAFARAAAAVCDQLARANAHEERAQLARRWLDVEPASADAALHLLEAIAAPGTHAARVGAVREYHALVDRLHRDLDVSPDPAVGARVVELARDLDAQPPEIAVAPPAVASDDPPSPGPASIQDAAEPTPRRSARSNSDRVLTAAALGLAFILAVLLIPAVRRDRAAVQAPAGVASAAEPRSVAVLRFRSFGADSADQYFSDGMAEELIQALGRIEGVQVTARSASFPLSADSVDPREVGRRLNVATVLEGSVRRSERSLRVVVRLINAADGHTMWQETYERELAHAFAVQDEIARAVATALRIELDRADLQRPRRATTDVETYDLYLRGRHIWWAAHNEQNLRSSIAHYRRALARDSSFAPAWVGLADAFLELTGSHDVAPADVLPIARNALMHALRLDPYLADAHASLGYLATFHDHQWSLAEDAFLKALALDERHGNARLWFAWMLTAQGRHDEALAQLRQARSHEPFSRLLAVRLATMLYFARDYESAIREARASIEADSSFWLPYRQLGEALIQVGKADEAVLHLRRATAMSPSGETRARLAHGLAAAGDIPAAVAILADLDASEGGYVNPVELARIEVALGRRDRAVALLERAVEMGVSAAVLINVEPAFDPLRSDPRFVVLVTRLGLTAAAASDRPGR